MGKTEIIRILGEKPRSFAYLARHVEGFSQSVLLRLVLDGVVEYMGPGLMYRLREEA